MHTAPHLMAAALLLGLCTEGWTCLVPPYTYSGASEDLSAVYFSVGPGRTDGPPPTTPPLGLPGSAVSAEHSANDSPSDDIYRGFFHPVGYSSVKIVDDGGANWGITPHPGLPNTMSLTISSETENVDALAVYQGDPAVISLGDHSEVRAALEAGDIRVQFAVWGDAFNVWATQPPEIPEVEDQSWTGIGLQELPIADVHEAVFGPWDGDTRVTWPGSNVCICDEDALGLRVEQWIDGINDEVDGVILEVELESLEPLIDTDGDTVLDTPWILFSLENPVGEIDKGTGLPISGADICMPSTGGPPATVLWSAADLGLTALDDIDALYVSPLIPEVTIVFSLAPGSPSLSTIANPILGGTGAGPGDLICVRVQVIPQGPPQVLALSTELGIDDMDDDITGLWITDHSLIGERVPVELSVLRSD